MTQLFVAVPRIVPPLSTPLTPAAKAIIRLMDIVLAASALLFLAPLLVVVALLIRFQDRGRGGVIFAQRRYGWRGQTFLCYKFRSMVADADQRLLHLLATDPTARMEWAADQKLRKDPRITPFGRFLRKTSIDELPQLFNVLRGDMSMVGPRPIVAAEVVRYGIRFSDYCAVRPGITGIWQIGGRNDVTYRRRIAMDTIYSRRSSVRLYVRVLAGTALVIVRGKGAY